MTTTARAAMAVLAVTVSLLVGCGDDGTDAGAPASPTSRAETETPAATARPAETERPADTEMPTEPAELEDGRHPGYIASIDVEGRSVTVDVIQFLTGADAVAAYAEDHPDDPDGPPNDYYIRNVNPRLRTIPVATDVAVSVIWLESGGADTENITFDELPSYFATNPDPDSPYEWWAPFWLTVRDGQVTVMEEQFIP